MPSGEAGGGWGRKTRQGGNWKIKRDEAEHLLWHVHLGKEGCSRWLVSSVGVNPVFSLVLPFKKTFREDLQLASEFLE